MPYQPQPVAPAPAQPIAPHQFQPVAVAAAMPGALNGPPQPISGQPQNVSYDYPPQQQLVQQPGVPPSSLSAMPLSAVAPGVKFENGQIITPKFTGPKPQEDHTLINCFSVDQIETHIASLNKGLQLPPQKLKTKCLEVLRVLQGHQHGWVFNSPVDPIELGLSDYFEVIKKPMDLGTIRKKLENNCYHSLEDFYGNVHLTFDNAMLYNPEGSVVYNMAKEMKDKFESDYELLMKELNAEEDVKRKKGDSCLLCGCEKLLFEPPVFYCNGANCPSKRIRRNSYYYVGANNQYHWCHVCFQDLKEGQLLEIGEVSIRKDALTKKKNDETHEESWVQCDRCERWVHQICALFNTRQNKDQRSEYSCPRCTIEERKKNGRPEATSTTPMAEDLQRTKLSEFVENHVRQKMDEHLKELANEKMMKEGMTTEQAAEAVHMGGAITIRQVTSMDRKLEVRERMKKRYAFKNYPEEFSYRCKCFIVFQNLDGVDVILFGLYVYEHDEKNPNPNKRTVYVSYLDSVHYMRPRSMRTFIYHEILISYLDYVRQKGFSTAHIWACPPLKGDDYILYAKPEDQKTPRDDRLRQWYIDMLVECQRRGIVGKLTNMYDLYFSNPANDATVVPYMEGDYFPAEVENIIKDIEEGKASKKSSGKEGKKKKGDVKQKKKSGRGGTRSTGLDEDALKASGVLFPGKDQKSLEEGGRDYVMVKLGETIQPMKDSFIVAFLAWKGAKAENLVVPQAIKEYRKQHNIVVECGEDIDDKSGEEKKADEDIKGPSEENSEHDSVLRPIEQSNDKPDGDVTSVLGTDADVNMEVISKDRVDKKADETIENNSIQMPGGNFAETSLTGADEKSEEMLDGKSDEKQDIDSEAKAEDKPIDIVGDKEVAKPLVDNKSDATGDGKLSGAVKEESKDSQDVDMKDVEKEAAHSDQPEVPAVEVGPENIESTEAAVIAGAKPAENPVSSSDPDSTPVEIAKSKNSMLPEVETDSTKQQNEAALPTSTLPTTPVPGSETSVDGAPQASLTSIAPAPQADAGVPLEAESDDKSRGPKLSMEERSGKFAAMAKKRGIPDTAPSGESDPKDKKEKENEADPAPVIYVTDSKGRRVKVIDDDLEEMDCEFLNNRQAFLNLCQGNHYQFDHVRRAKHSSMMVLWHLHNRDAPKFVQQCTTCSREILTGYRYHCPTCADFDQCQECVHNPNTPRHPHTLKPIPVAGQQTELTEAQRKERQRSIQLHMTLLLHAATCTSPKCPSANCTKMKGLLKHGAQCTVKATGGCNVCKRIWALLQIHARQCKAEQCPVPNCMAIRERVRQLKKQQQAMDDRRRQEMNRVYRGAR